MDVTIIAATLLKKKQFHIIYRLKIKGYTYSVIGSNKNLEEYEVLKDNEKWRCYLFTAQDLNHYEIERNSLNADEEKDIINIPSGEEGGWMETPIIFK